MLEMLSKHGNTNQTSNLRTEPKIGLWTNILLRNFHIHMSTNFFDEVFLHKCFFNISTSKLKLEKSETSETPM